MCLQGLLSRAAFNRVFSELVPEPADNQAGSRDLRRAVLSGLFDLFDADGNGLLDFTELVAGVSMLCGGDRDDKIRAAFTLFGTCCTPGYLRFGPIEIHIMVFVTSAHAQYTEPWAKTSVPGGRLLLCCGHIWNNLMPLLTCAPYRSSVIPSSFEQLWCPNAQ